MLAVHDVVARGQVVEEPVGGPGPRPGGTMGPPAPGEVGLGQDGHLGGRHHHAALERGHHDPDARARQVEPVAGGRRPSPVAVATTGTTMPSSARTAARRAAEPAPSAHTVTE